MRLKVLLPVLSVARCWEVSGAVSSLLQ
jgi:hypothetical protein